MKGRRSRSSLGMIAAFLAGSCILKILSVSLARRLAGFRGLDLLNLAITTNARGGLGIVLASGAFDAGIISPAVLNHAGGSCRPHVPRQPVRGSITCCARAGRY